MQKFLRDNRDTFVDQIVENEIDSSITKRIKYGILIGIANCYGIMNNMPGIGNDFLKYLIFNFRI